MSDTRLDAELPLNRLFVYGTLRQGECRHRFLAGGGIQSIVSATFEGVLIDLREYPGLVRSAGRVYGELISFGNLAAILPQLDQEESFLYNREVVEVQTEEGQILTAWAYLLRTIDSGDWRKR